MISLRTLFSLPIFLSTALVAHAYARPDGVIAEDRGGPRPRYATSLTGGEGCSGSELSDIRDGFAEMTSLFAAAVPFDNTSQPSVEFFGRWPRIANYTDMIAENLARAAAYGTIQGREGPVNADIHVRCDDPVRKCDDGGKRDGSHVAYNIANEPHIVFCNEYFRLDGLDRRVGRTANNQMNRDKLMEYYNRATLWARMVMHFSDIGQAVVQHAVLSGPNSTSEWTISTTKGAMNTSVLAGVLNERPDFDPPGPPGPNNNPPDFRILKYAYGATRSKLLAVLSTQMPYDAANNAENYALYAQARYVMQKKKFYPNLPIMDFSNEATVLTNENLQDGERVKFAYFDKSDVLDRPPGMERSKGSPLPSSDASTHKIYPSWTCLMVIVMVHYFVVSPFG